MSETVPTLPTALVSDALDRFGIVGQCHGLLAAGDTPVAGPAFTVRYRHATGRRGEIGDFLDDAPPGSVLVLDNGGRTDCTVWGGLMTHAARAYGIAGTVIDGVHRDSAIVRRLGYGLFSRGPYMRTGKDRVTLDGVGCSVRIGGVTVEPGDIIVADGDGVVVVPAARSREVLQFAEEIRAAETRIERAVADGSRLDRARDRSGYHELQRPPV